MAYYRTAQLGAQAPRGMALARDYFIFNGFLLTEVSPSGFRATRPPRMAMHNNPLGMISEVSAEQMGGALTLRAQYGGQKWLYLLIMAFVLLICGLAFLDIQTNARGGKGDPLYPLLAAPALVGVILAAIFASFRQAARKLLDNLLANATKISEMR